MAFEINDLKGILILVLFAISTVASTNINCNGRAFHCVNSTHFMICVDLGRGVSTTIDDFVIPCPAMTECHENNMFECDFPKVTTTSPLKVIGVNKASDTSEPTLVTNSVTTLTPTSDIFSEFKENVPATTAPIADDVTTTLKLEVLENIMNREGVNSDSTTEASVTSSLIESKIDIFNDKKLSNNTITTSATDNNKLLEHAVDTSMHETVNTSSTDKLTSIDMVTSVIGLINLISTDPSSDVSTNPSPNIITSSDSSNDNIATTTEQYNTKEVTIHGIKIENVTHKLNIPIDIIFSEKSVIADEVSMTPVPNTLVVNEIFNKIENKTNSDNQTVAEQNSFVNSNNSNKILAETTTEYVPVIKNVTIDLNPHATTDSSLVPTGIVDLINAEPKQNIPNTKDNINTFLGDTMESTNNFNTKLETTLSEKPLNVEIISTAPIAKNIVLNVLKSENNNNSTGEMGAVDKAKESNRNNTFSEPATKTSIETSTELFFVPITTEATIVYTTERTDTAEALINNDFLEEKQTQPSEIIITTDLPKVATDNFYQINGESSKNILVDTMNSAVYSGTDIISHKVIEPFLLLSPSTKTPSIEMTTAKILQKGLTTPGLEIAHESLAISGNSVNEPLMNNLNNDTLLNNMVDPINSTETITTVLNTLSSNNITNGKGTEPTTKSYHIEVTTTETLQNEFTKHALEAQTELSATNVPINVNKQNLENVEINSLSTHTTNSPYKVTLDPVKNTIIKDFTSQSGIETNPQIGFTPEITHKPAHKPTEGYISMDHETTQKAITDSVTKIPELLTRSHDLNVDQRTITFPSVVSTITPFKREVKGNTSISDIEKSGSMENTSTTSFVKTEDELKTTKILTPASNQYVTELLSTTPETINTTPSVDSITIVRLASTNTPNYADTHSVSTADHKDETSTTISVDAILNTSYFQNATDIKATTLPHHNLLSQINYSTTTATESVSNFVPSSETTAAYKLDIRNIDFNTSNHTVNSTETLNSINGKNAVNSTLHEPTERNKKDENIKIVSVLDIVNTSGNTMPIEILQPTTSKPSLSNDYIKTTDNESQASSVYVSTTDNVHDYNSMYVEESSTHKNSLVILPVPTTEKLMNRTTTTAVHYVTEKTNDFSTGANITQQNSAFSLGSVISDTANLLPDGFTKEPVTDEATTIKDHAFITSSILMKPEVVTDNNIRTGVKSPSLSTKVMEPQTVTIQSVNVYNTEYSQMTTEPTDAAVFVETTPVDAIDAMNPNVPSGIKPTDFQQSLTSKVNPIIISGIKSTYLPHYVSSTAGNDVPQSKPSLSSAEVIAAQMTTEPTYNTKISETTPLTTPSNTDQDILPGIKTTDLSQYATTTVTYFDSQSISDIKTKTIIDLLTTPDPMVETIKVVGNKESGTNLGGTILSEVMFNTSTVDNVRTVKSMIDHENIVVGTTFKNDKQNTPIASVKPVDNSKVEIVNHTEVNWMPEDINIDNVKIKEPSIQEDDLKYSVKSGTEFKNKTLHNKDGKPVDKIEYRLTTVKADYKKAESGASNNETQSKLIITNENKNETINGSLNANIEIINVNKYKVPVDSIKKFDSYIKNNTKANNNLSLQNSTLNDELEQHLISTNHTITAEVQSHLNESDKQSNKANTKLTLNGTSVHNLNLTSTKFNARSKNNSGITIPASVFKCSNLTRGKYSDKKDCRKFYTCVGNLQPIVGICPNNTVFSEINKQCTRNLSHCVRNNQFQCLFEGRFSDFFKDNIYYICVKNRIHGFIRYKLKCQDSYHLNKALVKCEKNEEIFTQSGSVSETINDESRPKPKSEKIVSSDDFECEKVGKFPYAKDCSKYYECTKVKDEYRRKIKKCASDEVFDKKKKKCVESDSGEC